MQFLANKMKIKQYNKCIFLLFCLKHTFVCRKMSNFVASKIYLYGRKERFEVMHFIGEISLLSQFQIV